MKKIIVLSALLIFASPPLSYGVDRRLLEGAGLQVLKEEAPRFTLSGDNGGRLSLKDLRGKPVILHFWATWCTACKDEFPAFERIFREYKDKGAVILAVSIDSNVSGEELEAAARSLGGSFPVFLAKDGEVSDRYWTLGVPVTYFIDKKGNIVGRALGPRDWAGQGIRDLINDLLDER